MGLVTEPAKGPWLMLLVCLAGAAIVDSACPGGWLSINQTAAGTGSANCYKLFGSLRKTFADSQEYCKELGGYLARDKTSNIHEQLTLYIYEAGKTYTKPSSFWIGLTDTNKTLPWKWVGGSQLESFNAWENNIAPYNSENMQDCIYITTRDNTDGSWSSTADCTINKAFVCERPTDSLPLVRDADYAPSANCDSGWEEDKKSVYCYQINQEELSWPDAQRACTKVGSNLVSIHSEEQQSFLTGILQIKTGHLFWIGASDPTREHRWTWVDYSPFSYFNWAVGQPNKPHYRHCVGMRSGTGKWAIWYCGVSRSYICGKRGKRTLPTVGTTTSPISVPSGKKWGCPPGWKGFRNSCYGYFVPKSAGVTWDYAKTYCQEQKDAKLVSITDQVENDFIYNSIPRNIRNNFWIGLNDKVKENTFVWSDNTPVTYTNWASNEPNNDDGEDCGVMYTTKWGAGRWNNDDCTDPTRAKKLVICEKSKAFLNTISPALTNRCLKNTVGNQDSCYLLSDTPRTFSDADLYCNKYGGTLATVPDNYVQAFLSHLVGKQNGTAYWIGLSSGTATNDGYAWTSGSPVRFSNWAKGHTEGKTNNCVAMQVAAPPGLWTDHDCTSSKLPLVCEIVRVSNTPSSTNTTSRPAGPCPSGWYTRGSLCYKAFGSRHHDLLNWEDAQTKCESLANGGNLVALKNTDLTSWLFGLIFRSGLDRTHKFWIGLSDRDQEGVYKWTDGSPTLWTHWSRGEPNEYRNQEDCAEVDLSRGSERWNDALCQISQYYICQIPKGSALNPPKPTVSIGTSGDQCGNSTDWTYFNDTNKCYFVSPKSGQRSRGTWFEAQRFCHAMGAELTSIHSAKESKAIFNLVSKRYRHHHLWIGMNDIDSKSHRWVDGSPVDFWNWKIGEPNNYKDLEHCVEINARAVWEDDHCRKVQGYVCKRDPGDEHSPIKPIIPKGYCPPGFSTHDLASHCYKVELSRSVYFEDALNICEAIVTPGTLAVIHNKFDNQFIVTLLRNLLLPAWIGFIKLFDDKFSWIDNSEVTYVNWGGKFFHYETIFPTGAVIQNGAQMVGLWSVQDLHSKHHYICQTVKNSSLPKPEVDNTDCSTGYQRFGNNCYKYINTPYIWTYAEQLCQEDGGHLMSISDRFESAFFYVLTAEADTEVWTGLKYDPQTQLYKWSDGEPLTLEQWGINQPADLDGDRCVISNLTTDWQVSSCLMALPFVCEMNSVPTARGPVGETTN